MTKVVPMRAPMYKPGQVIDLTYKNGGLPNRIVITKVWCESEEDGWMYRVTLESERNGTDMAEKFITQRACDKSKKCYGVPAVVKRYKEGWRFCGNYRQDMARVEAQKLVDIDRIEKVRLTEAYYPDGNFAPNQLALWIKYLAPISDVGDSTISGDTVIDIK